MLLKKFKIFKKNKLREFFFTFGFIFTLNSIPSEKIINMKIHNILEKCNYETRSGLDVAELEMFFLKQNNIVREGDLVFDVGANRGEKTALYLRLGASEIICFEPIHDLVNLLQERFREQKKVKVIESALGREEKEGYLHICTQNSAISTFSQMHMGRNSWFAKNNYTWDKIEKVSIKTLDSMIKRYGVPHFCKIDVEEYELEVLSGLKKLLPKILSFEFHGDFSDKIEQCLKLCKKLGYTKFNVSLLNTSEFVMNQHVEDIYFLSHIIKCANKIYMERVSNWDLFGDVYAFI